MKHLKSWRGEGQISFDDRATSCSYSIDVDDTPGLRTCRARILADDGWLFDATGKTLTLRLSHGAAMQVAISRHVIGSGEAEVKSSGPIPEF
jgi:hypothetical protein